VKTLGSKETKASKEITVTHNSVFAAHRLQCRMTIHKIDIRHFLFSTYTIIAVVTLYSKPFRRFSTHTSGVVELLNSPWLPLTDAH